MHYLILVCFLLAFTNFSVTEEDFQVQQNPRFYGTKTGRLVRLVCSTTDNTMTSLAVKWYKAKAHDDKNPLEFNNSRANKEVLGHKTYLTIEKVTVEDSGIYVCQINNKKGFGSELQVFRPSNQKAAEWRSKVKDFIIFLQAFLLVLCIVLPSVWYYRLQNREEAVYEEPEDDHTYEGLEIEHCGDIYEDIPAFTPPSEASWQVESPEQE